MKVSEILQLDCRKEENLKILNKALKKIPFLSGREITLEVLEDTVAKINMRYGIRLSYIMPSIVEENVGKKKRIRSIFSFMLRNEKDKRWLKTIYSATIYEGFAKTVLFMYVTIKKQKEEENES